MSDKMIENNQVTIIGEIASEFRFSHEVFGEGFYTVEVLVRRLSNSEDKIPLMVSERLVDVDQDYRGEFIYVTGQFRSYNRHEETKNRLVLSVFVRELTFVEESFWKDFSANFRSIVRLRLAVRLPTFSWQSTALTASPTTFPVSAGDAMPDTLPVSRSDSMYN